MYHLIINSTLKTSVGVGDGKLDCSDRLAPDTHLSDINLWLHLKAESEISFLICVHLPSSFPFFLSSSIPLSLSPSLSPYPSPSPFSCFPSLLPVALSVRQERSLFPAHWLLLVASKKLNLLIPIKRLLSPEPPNRAGGEQVCENQAYLTELTFCRVRLGVTSHLGWKAESKPSAWGSGTWQILKADSGFSFPEAFALAWEKSTYPACHAGE